jgi:hypothetical protein
MRYFLSHNQAGSAQSISQHCSFLGVSKPSRILSVRFLHFYLELGASTEPKNSIVEIAFPVERITGAELAFLESIQ